MSKKPNVRGLKKREYLIATGILLLLLFIYFLKPATLSGMWATGDLGSSDLLDLNWPLKTFLSSSLKNGHLPLWSPDLLCGMPLHAEGEGGFFHPLNLILFSILPPLAAYNWSTIFIYLIAGFGMWLYLRRLNLSFLSSLVPSIVFILSGFFICHLKHPAMILSAASLPYLFWIVESFIQRPKPSYLLLGGIFFGFQLLSGHPQITVYSAFGLLLYLIFQLPQRFIEIYREYKRKKKKGFLPILYLLLFLPGIWFIGILIGSIQLLPTMELLEHSGRRIGEAISELENFPYHPEELITFILPYHYGDPALPTYNSPHNGLFWENTAYCGIIPLILALLSLWRIGKNRHILFFFLLLILSILLAFGKYSPFLFLLKMPPFSSFRFPNRFLLLSIFSLCTLTGFSLQMLSNRGILGKVAIYPIFFLIVLDLWSFGHHHNPCLPAKEWLKIPESVSFLKEREREPFRILSVGTGVLRNAIYYKYGWLKDPLLYQKHHQLLPVNSNLEYNLSSPETYLILTLIRSGMYQLSLERYLRRYEGWSGGVTSEGIRILSLLNVKYLISSFNLKGDGLVLIKEIPVDWEYPSVKIYENTKVLARAFLVPSAKLVDPNVVIEEIASGRFNPTYQIGVEEPTPQGSISILDSSCKIIRYSPNYVNISAKMKAGGFLFVSDANYPGWEAYVDGVKTRIYYANTAFRAVYLIKGDHIVKFKYSPASFKKGALITILSLILILFLSFRKNLLTRNK